MNDAISSKAQYRSQASPFVFTETHPLNAPFLANIGASNHAYGTTPQDFTLDFHQATRQVYQIPSRDIPQFQRASFRFRGFESGFLTQALLV
jgi:hypothetical protein